MTKRLRRLLGGLVCLLLCTTVVWGQRTTGSFSGQVVDPTGAAVNGANVIVENNERGFKLEVGSNEEGSFTIPDLPPGTYKVSIQHEGFKTHATSVVIRVNATTSIVARLELGMVSAMVMVESGAMTVDTTSATVQGVITGDQIDRLPLNGRAYSDLALLTTNVHRSPLFNGQISGIHHVAVAIGNGQMVEAPYSGGVVQVASIYEYGSFFGATRPLS